MLALSLMIIKVPLKTIEDTRKLPPAEKSFKKLEFLIGDRPLAVMLLSLLLSLLLFSSLLSLLSLLLLLWLLLMFLLLLLFLEPDPETLLYPRWRSLS